MTNDEAISIVLSAVDGIENFLTTQIVLNVFLISILLLMLGVLLFLAFKQGF